MHDEDLDRDIGSNPKYIENAPWRDTYNHRIFETRLPVRSAIYKQDTGGLVVRCVTTSEYPLLYVFNFVLLNSVLY